MPRHIIMKLENIKHKIRFKSEKKGRIYNKGITIRLKTNFHPNRNNGDQKLVEISLKC